VGITPQHAVAGWLGEKHRLYAAKRERLERIGRAGEIVTVIGKKGFDG